MPDPINVTIIGGGMITNDLILPSIYHLQRTGVVGTIDICALNTPPLKALKEKYDRSLEYDVYLEGEEGARLKAKEVFS